MKAINSEAAGPICGNGVLPLKICPHYEEESREDGILWHTKVCAELSSQFSNGARYLLQCERCAENFAEADENGWIIEWSVPASQAPVTKAN